MLIMQGDSESTMVEIAYAPNAYEYTRDREKLMKLGSRLLFVLGEYYAVERFTIDTKEGEVSTVVSQPSSSLWQPLEAMLSREIDMHFPDEA